MYLQGYWCAILFIVKYSHGFIRPVPRKFISIHSHPTSKYDSNVPRSSGSVPDHVDWRKYDIIKRVKDQNICAACWAFSVVGNIESHLMIHLKMPVTLSEQFLIDCSEYSKGCGNTPLLKTFSTIVTDIGGVLRDQDYYPYSLKKERCRWAPLRNNKPQTPRNDTQKIWSEHDDKYESGVKEYSNALPIPVVGVRRVQNDEEVMKEAIFKHGPLSAAINSAAMGRYGNCSNVWIDEPTDEECNPKELDHTILIVGYSAYINNDTGTVTPYWIIKNSWGKNWGDEGFYYLVSGRNACGIASDVSFAYVT